MASSFDPVECDGCFTPSLPCSLTQSGIEVSEEQLPTAFKIICSTAYQPSDEFDVRDNTKETSAILLSFTKTSSVSQTSCPAKTHVPTTLLQAPIDHMAQMKTQQEVQRKPTKTNQQTVANVSSASHMKSSKKSPLPKYPLYAAVPQRMTSFASVVLSVSTQLLSAAGFFLVPNGGADATRCFHCGIGLRHWSQDDDPWVEHARFSPNCDFLLNMKGQEFVNLIQLAVKYSSNQTSNNDSKPPHNTSTSTNASCPSLETEDKTRNDLVRENAELRSITKCMYCTCRDVSLVFLPCGHLISCEQCGKEQRTCRMCGCIVKGTVRTFRY